VANFPKEKLKLQFGLTPNIPDPVPEGILDPSINQTRVLRDHQVFVPPVITINSDLKGPGVIKVRNYVIHPHFKNGVVTHFLPDG
jgi:hypothetical protein